MELHDFTERAQISYFNENKDEESCKYLLRNDTYFNLPNFLKLRFSTSLRTLVEKSVRLKSFFELQIFRD